MRLKEFSIGVSQTFNLGSYESYKFEVSETWEVPLEPQDEKDWPMRWAKLKAEAQAELLQLQKETYTAQKRKRNGTG